MAGILDRGRMLRIGVAGIAAVVAFLAAGAIVGRGSDLEEGLRAAVEQVGPSLPVAVDAVTTWTGIEASADTLTLTYTLAGSAADYDKEALLAGVKPDVVAQVCGGSVPAVSRGLSLGATFRYQYVAEDGGAVGAFTVTQADCGAEGDPVERSL